MYFFLFLKRVSNTLDFLNNNVMHILSVDNLAYMHNCNYILYIIIFDFDLQVVCIKKKVLFLSLPWLHTCVCPHYIIGIFESVL